MERVARDNARPILRMLITEGGADLTVRDRAGVDVLCRAATVAGRVEKNSDRKTFCDIFVNLLMGIIFKFYVITTPFF